MILKTPKDLKAPEALKKILLLLNLNLLQFQARALRPALGALKRLQGFSVMKALNILSRH